MARPKIFVSSTFYDLKHIRSSIESFIESLDYEAVLSEKGSIAYNPDIPLDDSCYREAQNCDIFVIIIGGRYGSPSSHEGELDLTNFYKRYESVTKMEYESALKRDIPIYILIEKAVKSEYETFKKNRSNESIKYAHVDSINIFLFIDRILKQNKNNPVKEFEKHIEIEQWLKIQWAGLFNELLSSRNSDKEIAELSYQITELSNINTTLKRYLEEVMISTSKESSSAIIEEEEQRIKESRKMSKIKAHLFTEEMIDAGTFSNLEEVVDFVSKPKSFKELAKLYAEILGEDDGGKRLLTYWKEEEEIRKKWNDMREILELAPFK
jgi:hypothetical protein